MKKGIKFISILLILTVTIQFIDLQAIFSIGKNDVNASELSEVPSSTPDNSTVQDVPVDVPETTPTTNEGGSTATDGSNNAIVPTLTTVSSSSIEGDIENPTAPTYLVVVSKSNVSVSMKWNASQDNVEVIAYDIYDGEALIGTSISTSYEAIGLQPKSAHSFKVKARDAKGNISIDSNILNVTTDEIAVVVDKEVPTAPTNFSLVSKTSTTAVVTWNESTDNVGVKNYVIYNDGVKVGTTAERNFTIQKLTPNTTYNFTVRAIDEGANVSLDSNTITVTTDVDNEVPTVPTNFAVMSKTSTSITFTWDKSTDNAAVVSYDIFEGTQKVGNANDNIFTITGIVPSTTHSYTIKAKDGSGNISAESAILEVTTAVDTETPTTPIELVQTSKTSTSVGLSWSNATDNVGIVGYEIYEGVRKIGETTGETNFIASELTPNTSYHFMIKAKDGAGNVSLESTILSVTTDNIEIINEVIDDYGDNKDNAHEILVGSSNEGVINYEGDCDLLKFTINQSGIYQISVSNSVSYTGTLIDSSDMSISGIKDENGYYQYTLEAGKTYYLSISGGDINNRYTLCGRMVVVE